MRVREKPTNTHCAECTLKDCGYVPPQIPLAPQFPILFVGQAGGATEDTTGVPFTGKTGKLLWRLLHESGFNKRRLWITNTVGCVPPDDRKPTNFEVDCCHAALHDLIHQLQPSLIIAMGDTATQALAGKGQIKSIRGSLYPLLPKWNYQCNVFCTLHPSFILRQRQWIETAVQDFQSALQVYLDGQAPAVQLSSAYTEDFTFIYNCSSSDLALKLEEYSKSETSFDIETPGELNPRKAQVIAISFSPNEKEALAIELTKTDEKWEVMKRYLEDPRAKKITQNGQFDIACLETHDVFVKGLTFDTMLVEHLLNSDLPHTLDFLRSKYTRIEPYKPTKREMKTFDTWGYERRMRYSCLDALVTKQVALAQQELMTPIFWCILNEIDLPLIPVVNTMERKGMLVDVEMVALLHSQIEPQLAKMDQEIFAPLNLNPNSPTQLKKHFSIDTTGEDELQRLIKRGHPQADVMEAILYYRHLSKADRNYLVGMYTRLEQGRIHSHFSIPGTGTGRLSSNSPNLQNIPKELRIIYIADSEDHVLLDADYNQLEFKVIAVLAKERKVLDEIARGVNIHHKLGFEMFGKPWDELTDIQKLREKAVVFGTIGGRGERSIAMEFGIPTSLAKEWQDICFAQYPQFLVFKEQQMQAFQRGERIKTAYGRERVVRSVPQALNTPMQGSAGDVTKTSLIELHKLGVDLRLTVHDSIIIQARKEDQKDAYHTLKRVMERPIPELVDYQFTTKVGIGPNWYHLEEVSYE